MAQKFFIAGYSKAYSRVNFSCGKPELDDWLKTQATQHQKSGNTRIFLAVSSNDDAVVGFYATTAYRLDLNEAAVAFGAGKIRFPLPAVLLARLAVDERFQGQGLGTKLLVHALDEVARASRSVGFEMLVVHAIDREAAEFYAKAGFTRFLDAPMRLYLPLKDLLATTDNR